MKCRGQHPLFKPIGKTQQDDIREHVSQLYGTLYMVRIRKNLVGPQRRPKERRKTIVVEEHGTFIDEHTLYGLNLRAWTLQERKAEYKYDLSVLLPVEPWASYLASRILSSSSVKQDE